MKPVPKRFLTEMLCVCACMLSACSPPESHITEVVLKNDLGKEATLSMCKDIVHCGSTSDLFPPQHIPANVVDPINVSTEDVTVFKVTTETNGKTDENCLRFKAQPSSKTPRNVLLSSATGC